MGVLSELLSAMEEDSGAGSWMIRDGSSKEVPKASAPSHSLALRPTFIRQEERWADRVSHAKVQGGQLEKLTIEPKAMAAGSSLTWKRKSAHLTGAKEEVDDGDFVRKKLKLSDLPLGGTQRSTIDALLLTFKKSGEFDKLRKAVFSQFEQSVSYILII
jgi:hypothetical protein